MPIIQFQKEHGGAAFIAPEGVIAESMEDGRTPFIKAAIARSEERRVGKE